MAFQLVDVFQLTVLNDQMDFSVALQGGKRLVDLLDLFNGQPPGPGVVALQRCVRRVHQFLLPVIFTGHKK